MKIKKLKTKMSAMSFALITAIAILISIDLYIVGADVAGAISYNDGTHSIY